MSSETFNYKQTSLSQETKGYGAVNLDSAEGIVECFVAGIGNKDSVGDVCAPGAFTKSLLRRKPRVVWGHNWNDPIGKVLEIYEVGPNDPRLPLKMKLAAIGGLFAKVQFNLNSEKGKEAFANVAFFGEEQEWSIGYKTLRAQFDQKSQSNVLYEVELYEVSPVLHGANQLTGTISVKTDESSYGSTAMVLPQQEQVNPYGEIEKELSNFFNSRISVHSADDNEVVFTRHEMSGAKKYKCGFMRNQGRYMFGTPEAITVQPTSMMPSQVFTAPVPNSRPMPQNEPQRMNRPQQQAPRIPAALKPGMDGLIMIPLPAMQYENTPSKPGLDKEEADLRDALLKIVSRHGKFNEDNNGVWAGYTPARENEIARIGVKCANCVFYQGGSKCKIIDMPVEPEGKCRFAVIPNGIVLSSGSKELEEHVSEAENAIIDVLEFKYPGEFVLGIVRNAVGKKKKKRNKYKNLSEFGDDDDTGEKSYLIPVQPDYAYKIKTALDPIFDHHRADAFVDLDGIVITSGVTTELIDAVDTALYNLKKKNLETDVEEKALGYRIGRALGAGRNINRPNIGGRKPGRGFGMPDGDLDPRTRVDKNRDGTLFDNIPGWEQPDPTPEGPGSINNRKLSSAQKRDISKISGEGESKKPKSEKIIDSRKPNKKPRYSAADVSEISDTKPKKSKRTAESLGLGGGDNRVDEIGLGGVDGDSRNAYTNYGAKPKKEIIKRGEFDFGKKPSKDKSPALSSGAKSEWTETSDGLEMDAPEIDGLYVVQGSKQNGYVVTRYSDGVRNGGVEQTEYEHDEVFKSSASAKKWAEKDLADIANSEDSSTLSSGGKPKKSTRTADALGLGGGDNRVDEIGLGGVDGDSRNAYTNYGAKPKKSTGSRNDSELSSGRKPASNRKPTKKNIADGNLVLEKLKIKLKESQDPDNYNSQANEYSKYPIIAAIKESEKVINAENRIEARQIVLDVEKRSKDWRASAEEAYAAGHYTNVREEEAAYDAARETFNAMYGSLNTGVDYRRDARFEKGKKDSPLSLSSGANKEWATARGYEPDRFDLRETMNQIGKGNIMAISGGRAERRGNELILPSTKDQQVVIGYSSVPDLYYVRAEQKINAGKDKGSNKILAQWDDVYADELGEIAYQASLKPATLNSENKEYWKLGKDNQFADRLVDRRSGKLVDKDSQNIPAKPSDKDTPTLSSGSRGRDYYKYDIETSDDGDGLLDQIHDSLFENPSMKDDITADIADALGGDGIIEANGFDTERAFSYVTGSDGDFQEYMDMVDDAMDALQNGSLAKHKATVRDTNIRLESLKPGDDGYSTLESLRDRSYEWIGDINKYSRISTIKDKKNIEANDVATRMISKEQDALWNARSVVNEKYIEDITSAKKESAKRRAPIDTIDTDTNEIPDYDVALSSGSVFKDKPASKTLSGKSNGITLSSGENKKIYDEIGKSILEALIEMDKNPTATYWDVPWRTPTLYARNPTKNRLYQGMNSLLLANSHRQNQYRGSFWAGKTQWAKFGGTVKKGKNGVNILVPRDSATGKYFVVQTVYNLDDIEGLPDAYVKKLLDVGKERLDPVTKIKDAESVIDEIKPVVKFGGDRAYFSITNDHIQMPPYEMFKSPEQYYSTLLHELTHWTGGKSRLGRKQKGEQEDEKAYSFEELIAEMGSSFLLAALGITPEVRQDHAIYIKSWISNLKQDPGAFVRAMTEAQQAADWIMDRSPTMRRLSGVPDNERKGKLDVAKDATESTVDVPEQTKDSVTALSSGTQVGLRKVKELRYFGDENQYGSGVTQRDSQGRILDESGAPSLSSGAKPIVSLDGKITVPRLDDSVSYKEKYKFLADEFEPTEQQKASIDTLQYMLKDKLPGIVTIGAGAGSGKTTNLKQNARAVAAIFPGAQIYYTVFNRGNAKDGNRVMPRNTGVATGNQIAYWSLVLGTGDSFYGPGTSKKLTLGVGPRDSRKLRGAKKNSITRATTFNGKTKEFKGEIPGYRELGYTSYDSAPNITERLAQDGIISELDEITDGSFDIAQSLKKALARFAESSDDKLSAKHFLLRDIEMIQAILKGDLVPTEDDIPKLLVEYAQKLWDETVDPKSNVLIPQDYQIKMWALTKPDLRYDKGLIGHRPNETTFDRQTLGTEEELKAGKIKIGDIVEIQHPSTGEKVAAVIRKINPTASERGVKGTGVTGTVSIVSVTSDKPLDVFMFDEAQDVNPVLAKVLADNAMNMPIIMVGDSRQAIYGFRGAMDALEKANAMFRLPLTRSFRYGAVPAYLANVVLMQGNINDLEFNEKNNSLDKQIFHHVIGEAQNVVINSLNIDGPDGKILPKKDLDKKLKFIEAKYKLDGRSVSLTGKTEKEIRETISKLKNEHVPLAEGRIIEDMTNAQAVLTSTNSGVMTEALEVITQGINTHQMAYLDLKDIEDIKISGELAERLRIISEKYSLDGVGIDLIDILEKDGRDAMLRTIGELREEHAPGGEDGKIPAIGIPADTHEKFLDFFTQLDWIFGDLDKKFGIEGRPKPSKLLKDVWRFDKKKNRYPTKEEMIAKINKMIDGGESELRTLYHLAYPREGKNGGIRGDAKGARFFKDLLRPQGQKYTDINGKEQRYQGLRPMREGVSLPTMESGSDNLTADLMDEIGRLKPGVKAGNAQKISWIIPKREVSQSAGEVFVKLHIDENGKPSGALIIGGDGAHGGKYKFRKWNKNKKQWDPVQGGKPGDLDYHENLLAAIKKVKAEYPDAVIEFRQGLVQQVGTAQTFSPDIADDFVPLMKGDKIDSSVPRASLPAFFIQGKDREETARIANEIGNRVRKLATEGNTNTDIMTVHVAKGREWKRVRIADDFKNPEDMVPDISADELAKLSPKDKIIVERRLELMRREEHNKVYIAITRAQEQVDVGRTLAFYYFQDSIDSQAAIGDIQEIKKKIKDLDVEIAKLQKKDTSKADPQIKRQIEALKKEKTVQNKLLEASKEKAKGLKVAAAKAKIVENPEGIYDELQAPDGFFIPYADRERAEAALKERRKQLDESFDRYVKSQGKTKIIKPDEDDDEEIEGEDTSGGFDSGDPDFKDAQGPEDDDDDDDDDADSLSLSSGAKRKKNNRANRRLPYSEQDRQNVADRNILRSKKIPKKRKSGPSKEEFDGPSLSSGANSPSGRYARRLQALSLSSGAEFGSWSNNRDGANATPTNRISGRAFARSVTNSKILAGMRVDENTTKGELDSAQEFWRGMRKNGIALIASLEIDGSDRKTKISKSLKNMTTGISGVGKKMADRPKVEIGKVSSNQTVNDVDPENWFVPVSKLMDTIRIPTEFVVDAENRLTFSQTRPISIDELGEMLALDKSQIKKLADPDAGITHDSVRFLLAAIGSEKDFESWSLFSPVQGNELEGGDNAERFVENLGRGNMRDRFIIETFGKEAYPHWVDNEENKIITQDEYVSLGEVSATSKFRATGRFSKKKESEFEARAEYDLLEESMFLEGDTPSDAAKKKIVEDAKPQKPVLAGDKTKKEDFTVDKLLEHLKINKDKNWHNNLKDALQKLNGKEDLGLSSRDIALFWEKNGVPTIYTYEMIRAGLIPDAASVWDEDGLGKRFDGELTASKHAVYEALYEFTEAKHATDRAKNSKLSRSYILGAKDFETAHRDVVAKKGDIFSKKIGDVPRFSQDELQGVVNRFNEIFGTNYKIDDIFSAEQLRTVKERLSKGVSLYTGKNPELGARTILKKD